MKKISIVSLFLMAAVSCQIAELNAPVEDAVSEVEQAVYYVGMEEEVDTKTSSTIEGDILWTAGDKMNIFYGPNNNDKDCLELKGGEGTKNGSFYGPYIVLGEDEMVELHQTVIAYPFDENATCVPNEDKTAYTLSMNIPAVQQYVEGSFANGAYPMVGVTENPKQLVIETKNVASIINFRLKGTASISKIVLSSDKLALAGPASVVASYGNVPVATITEETASKTVELICDGGVQLSEDTDTYFNIVVAPCSGAINVTFYDTAGGYTVRTLPADANYKRGGRVNYNHVYTGENSIQKDLANAFKNGGEYTLPMDVTVSEALLITGGKTLNLDLNGYTLTSVANLGGTNGCIQSTGAELNIANGKINNKYGYLFVTNGYNDKLHLELTDVDIKGSATSAFYFADATEIVLNNVNLDIKGKGFYSFAGTPKGSIEINGGTYKTTGKIFDFKSTLPVVFKGNCLFSKNDYADAQWVDSGDDVYKWKPVGYNVFVGTKGYYSISDAVAAVKTSATITIADGTYPEVLKVTGGKNLTIQPQEGAKVTIGGVDHQSNGTASTVVFNDITFDNSIQTDGWFTGTAQNLNVCVGAWGGNLSFNDCTFNVAGTSGAETGVMTWWVSNEMSLSFSECTFNGIDNHASARAMQIYGKVNLTVDKCTFNTYKDYSLKYVGSEGTEAVLTDNIVNNTEYFVKLGSSAYPGNAYVVTISGSVLGDGIQDYIVDNIEEQIVNGVEYSNYPVRANGNKYMTVAEAIAGTTGDVEITIKDGTYNLPTSGFAGRNITFVGESKNGSIIDMSAGTTPQYGASSVTFKNLTMKRKAGDYGGFSHSAAEYYDGCIIEGTLVTYAPVVEVKNTDFVPATEEFYNVHIYGEGSSSFENCTFTTTACRSVYAYAESAKEMNISFKQCEFNSLTDAGRDYRYHQAIRIHTELGIHGTLTVEECEATGFNPAHNNGLWVEWNNGTKALTDNFKKVIDGKFVVSTAAGLQNALVAKETEIYLNPGTYEGTFKPSVPTAIKSMNPASKATIAGRVNASVDCSFENIKFEITDDSKVKNSFTGTNYKYPALVMVYAAATSFEGCEFDTDITSGVCSINYGAHAAGKVLKVNNCKFTGDFYPIRTRTLFSITNNEFDVYTDQGKLCAVFTWGNGGNDWNNAVVFTGNRNVNANEIYGVQLTSTTFKYDNMTVNVQNNTNFDILSNSVNPNCTFIDVTFEAGSETFSY